MLNRRISSVDLLDILESGDNAVIEIGDSRRISPETHVIAVQREKAIFFEHEFSFGDYEIFFRDIPRPVVSEDVEITTLHRSPVIQVKNIDIFSVSTSGVVHIGSGDNIRAEARIKHIRHLLREDD
ncbi:MAG: spore germination protein GerPE [Bacillaceae bacterium]|nr:spore germination protein GerPE [Bacillaceae bacterium]